MSTRDDAKTRPAATNARLVASLVLAGLVVVFVLQNAVVVEVRYLLWTLEVPRALLLFIVLAVGILIGWLLRAHQTRARSRSPDAPG